MDLYSGGLIIGRIFASEWLRWCARTNQLNHAVNLRYDLWSGSFVTTKWCSTTNDRSLHANENTRRHHAINYYLAWRCQFYFGNKWSRVDSEELVRYQIHLFYDWQSSQWSIKTNFWIEHEIRDLSDAIWTTHTCKLLKIYLPFKNGKQSTSYLYGQRRPLRRLSTDKLCNQNTVKFVFYKRNNNQMNKCLTW